MARSGFSTNSSSARALALRQRLAAAEVAVAGLGAVGHDAEGHQRTLGCRLGADRDRMLESDLFGDDVVGRHHQQDRIALLHRNQRGQSERRRGVASHRLEYDLWRTYADLAELFGDDEAILLVGDDQRTRVDLAAGEVLQAQRGLLQQRALAGKGEELLGIALARRRPQSGAGAAGEDHALDGHESGPCVVLSFGRVLQSRISRSMRATPSRQSGSARPKRSRSREVSSRELSGRAAAVG